MKKSTVILSYNGQSILSDLTWFENSSKKDVVIFCHGYKGYKDWGAWNLVAEEFAHSGFSFVKFNFSHNGGTIDNPIDFPDLKAFGNNTYSKEIEDLNVVIDWAKKNGAERIHLIGHSRGGGIVTIVAANNKNVSSVSSWAGVADFKERFPSGNKLNEWKEKGVYYVINGRTKQEMPHYYSFYEDFIENEEALTITKAVTKITIPHLIIHGDKDEAVSFYDANKIFSNNKKARLEVVEGANHTFGSSHPWNEQKLPPFLSEVVSKTINFISSSNKM